MRVPSSFLITAKQPTEKKTMARAAGLDCSRRLVGGRQMGVGVGVKELANRADDEPLLLVDQLGIDRQREGLACGRFGIGKITRLVAQRRETGLQMEWNRIVDLGADLSRGEILAQRVANRRRHADDVLVVHVETAGTLAGKRDQIGQAVHREQTIVAAGGLAAKVRPVIEVPQFDTEHGGLKGIEPGVEADLVMVILGFHAMNAQPRHRTA